MNRLLAAVILLIIAGTLYGGYALLRTPSPSTVQIEFGGVTLIVEIAKTASDQQKGLSDRDSIAPDHGMLFVFDHEGNWGFWMRGMRFSLDIIWFDSQSHAVFMKQGLLPCTSQDCTIYTPPAKAMYVLEVNAGFVQARKVALGDMFQFLS